MRDFGVRLDGNCRILTARSEKLVFGNIDTAGMPFYTYELTYLITPDHYSALTCSEGEQIKLRATAFFGGLVRLQAEGMEEQHLICNPYEADVTFKD